MRTNPLRWLAGSVCFGLLVLLVMPTWAAPLAQQSPLREGSWLSFDGSSGPADPELSLLSSDAVGIHLKADLPGCLVEESRAEDQVYSRLYGPGYGHPLSVGLPDLPVLRGDVEIPIGATIALEMVSVKYADFTLAELGLSPFYPLQPPASKCTDGTSGVPFAIDRGFYAHGSPYPDTPLLIGETYIVRGHRVQPVEVWPVAYDPSAGTVRLYREIIFRLKLTGSDMAQTQVLAERYASPAFESLLSGQLLNHNQGRPATDFAPEAQTGYLIITADAYHDAMEPFVTLRESRGFDVTMTRISEIPGGGSNTAIKAYIQEAYDTWPIPPSYVLLVGDSDTVPGWDSVSAGEVTDLYYATMDGPDDWHPDIGRGRFPVRSPAQTTVMVDKYLTYANLTGQEPWLKWASFIATCDLWQIAEGTHNYVINTYTEPKGYTGIFPNNPQPGGDKLYCITYNADTADVHTSLNQGRWAAIYSGHGSHTGWEFYSASDVHNLTNSGMFPFVASHACITCDFEEDEVYGETWVLEEDAGALVFWGSTDSSYWDEDDVLERAMFDSLFFEDDEPADVTEMTYFGLAETEAAYPGMARYYWETYNILGDPAVRIFLEPDLPTFTLTVEPMEHEICTSGSVTSTVQIGSILGYSDTVYLENSLPPAGVTVSFDPVSAQAPFTSELTLDVAAGTPTGDYEIILTATDNVSWTLDTLVNLRVDDSIPATPALMSPPDGAVDVPYRDILFQWSAVPAASSYRLQVDDDPGFGSPEVDASGIATNTYTLAGPLEVSTIYFWRVSALSGCGESPFSSIFSFTVQDLPCILLVDDDNNDIDVLPYFSAALDNLDYDYDVFDVGGGSSNGPDLAGLQGYSMVFWFSGDKYGGSAGPNGTDEAALTAYLDGGGKLFLSSQDYLYDFGLTPFGQNYLGIGSHTDDSGNASTKYGVAGDPIGGGLGPYPLTYPGGFTDYGDIVNAGAGASVAFRSSAAGGNNLDVDKDGGPWQTVFFGTSWVPVYNNNAANGEELLQRIIDWFGGCECQPVAGTALEWMPDTPAAGEAVTFTGTVAAGDLPIVYDWDFGDGEAGSGQTVAHTYAAEGDYTITLTATNACGGEVGGDVITVLPPPCEPVEVLEVISTTEGCEVSFAAELAGDAPYTYTWDFGAFGSSDEMTPTVDFGLSGTYPYTLTVLNCEEVYSDTITGPVTVDCEPPCEAVSDAAFDWSPAAPTVGQEVVFTGSATGTPPISYTWDFGDGNQGTGPIVSHTYAASDTYTIVMTAANCLEAWMTATHTIAVEPHVYYIYLPIIVKE